MRRLIIILCTIIIAFSLISCDTGTGADPEPLEFQMAPSDGLSTMINETPSDFTWEYFQDNVHIGGPSQTDFSKFDVVLHGFQINNGEVVNRSMTEPVELSADELSSGLLTEEIPPSLWMPGSEWVPSSDWRPKSTFIQTTDPIIIALDPALIPEVEDMVLNNIDLGTDETMVVVYPSIIGEDGREMTVQVFGLVFERYKNFF
ncbi:hypothetical protein [Fodinibius sp. AD559]|uniref:hypothetical protein n=1 Tax=Fodinibius sp. AD559 TaxID=3424179 RepID=UPI004046C7F6